MDDVLSAPVPTYVLIEALSIASLAAVSYVSTNLDNLILLSAYGAKPGTRPLFVKLTFVFVCLTVLFVSLALARAADTLPTVDLRYLGLVPMSLGAYQLVLLMLGGAVAAQAVHPGQNAKPNAIRCLWRFRSCASWPTAATASAS